MSIQPNHDAPASMEEIAVAIGKSKRTVERMAYKYNWLYSEAASHSRHKKRLYALKDLPWQIREAIQASRGQGQALPVSSESVAAMASCSSPADTDFKAIDMRSNLKLTRKLLKKLAIIFPLPLSAEGNGVPAFLAVWQRTIEDLDEADVIQAADGLLLTMTRFPYPAELREAVRSLHAPQGCDANHGTIYSLVQELTATQIALYKSLIVTQAVEASLFKEEDENGLGED